MRTVVLSLLVATLGLVASRWASRVLARRDADRDPHVHWALGLVALLPGWIVGFVALLGSAPVRRPEPVAAVAWTVSAAVALIGAIATEARVRRRAETGDGATPAWQWRMGVLTLVPALLAVVVGLLAR